MHDYNSWRHLWELKWNCHFNEQRLICPCQQKRNPMVFSSLRIANHNDVREERVQLLNLILSKVLLVHVLAHSHHPRDRPLLATHRLLHLHLLLLLLHHHLLLVKHGISCPRAHLHELLLLLWWHHHLLTVEGNGHLLFSRGDSSNTQAHYILLLLVWLHFI